MIAELERDSFQSVLPLCRAAGACFPLLLSVVENGQRGQVFVNRRDGPGAALVVNNFGFTGLFEAVPDEAFDQSLIEMFRAGDALRPSYLLWYDPPARWRQRLDSAGGESVRRRERVRFDFRSERAGYLGEPARCPAGFELQRLSPGLLRKVEKFGLNLESRFWSSADDFLERGMGVCLVKDGEVASLCYAAAVAGGLAEVDVVTDPEFRGRGLATVVAQQFIRECLGRGVTPTWDCFAYNTGSMRLAEVLGFVERRRYTFYSFNVPLSLAGDAGAAT